MAGGGWSDSRRLVSALPGRTSIPSTSGGMGAEAGVEEGDSSAGSGEEGDVGGFIFDIPKYRREHFCVRVNPEAQETPSRFEVRQGFVLRRAYK